MIDNKRYKLTIDKDHLNILAFPRTKENFQPLRDLCNSFDWVNNYQSLKRELEDDDRYVGLNEDMSQEIDIEYAKQNLLELIENIKLEKIKTGGVDYGILKNYLYYISAKLPKASQEIQKQILIHLAVKAGDYCGPGVMAQVQDAAFSLLHGSAISSDSNIPLKQRVLFNFASDFGVIAQTGAANDPTAQLNVIQIFNEKWSDFIFKSPLLQAIWKEKTQYFISDVKHEEFTGYTPDRILDAITTVCKEKESPIKGANVLSWFVKWIEESSNIEETQKNPLIDRLTNKPHMKFILTCMLVDMGILALEPD